MSIDTHRQFSDTLERGTHVLIAVRKDWNVDGLASALALKSLLEKRGKRADVVVENFSAPGELSFLPRLKEVQPAISNLQRFVITLDIAKTKVDEIFYDVEGDKLRIHVTPKHGRFEGQDLASEPSDFKYDLIVTLATPDLGSLGEAYARHTDFFFGKPTVNIDHDPTNERYGNINLVDITAASTAEVLANAVRDTGDVLDEDTATLLLAGVISGTRSFRSPAVTPRTLDIAAELMAAGARREEIVRSLYRTRDVPTLKLWGRALARLKHDPQSGFAWSVLVRQDFVHAGAGERYLGEVVEELIMNSPDAEVAGILYESPNIENPQICALIATEKHMSAHDLVKPLGPEGDRRMVRLCFPGTDMVQVEQQVLETVRKSVSGKRLEKPATSANQP